MSAFLKNLNTISRGTNFYREERLKEYGLTGCQVKYLFAVARVEGVSQDELARELLVNKSNVARQMAALEEAGYIRREQSPSDKRVYGVWLTQRARDLMPVIRAVNEEWKNILCGGLTAEERDNLALLLGKLVDNARRHWEDRA